MECFVNYIGLSQCAGAYDAPASGIYINTLPGLQLEAIDKIATQEQVNYLGVWADVQSNALPDFRIDVMAEIRKCYELDCECVYDDLICENLEVLTQAWKYKLAIWLLWYRINSNRLNRYTTIDIPQAKELLVHYQVEFARMLEASVKCMDISSCELCCSPNPSIVTMLP